jgi:hypothetical protein
MVPPVGKGSETTQIRLLTNRTAPSGTCFQVGVMPESDALNEHRL